KILTQARCPCARPKAPTCPSKIRPRDRNGLARAAHDREERLRIIGATRTFLHHTLQSFVADGLPHCLYCVLTQRSTPMMKIALPTSSKRLLVAILLSVCTFVVAGEAAALCSVTLVPTGVTSRPGSIDYRGSIVSNSGCACVNNDTGSFASS